jgi:PKD repeat protein
MATLDVPGDFSSIQAAHDAASSGDTILVAPGTYVGQITITKAITLASRYLSTGDEGYIGTTILDGGGAASVITIPSNAEDRPTIQGFTIQNGGDGIMPRAKFNLLNCVVRDTQDGVDYEKGSGGLVQYCTFELNGDDGIDLDFAVDVVIEDNIIRNNSDDGIEIRLQAYSGPTLDIIIKGNEIYGNGEDGIQLIHYDVLTDRFFEISYNYIYDNVDAGIGMMDGAISIEDFRAASIPERINILNNTFANNSHGITGGDNTVVLNNIFVGHSAIAVKKVDANSELAYNLFFNNGTNNSGSNVDVGSSVFADPLLTTDLELAAGSPAIDAGAAFFVWQGETVLDLPPSAYSGAAPDIGAFEFGAPGGPVGVIYITSTGGGSVGGVAFEDEDIVAYDGVSDTWSLYFDGSDVGLSGSNNRDVRAFELLANGDILLNVYGATTLPDVGNVDPSDIVRFSGSTGPNTSGTFSLYLRGDDVGLAGESIDAIGFAPDGRLVVSTSGSFNVPGASGADEDLIALDAGGSSWSLYFDGSDVDLNDSSAEDVAGVWIDDATGDVYLSTRGAFSVPNVSGGSSDVFICKPDALGSSTSCTYASYWAGSAQGLTSDVLGIHIAGSSSPSNQAPTASFTWSATALTVDFTDTSTDSDGTVVEWSWDFGDGGTSTQRNPSHTYAADGSYPVTLTATDNNGATDTKTQTVTVVSGSGDALEVRVAAGSDDAEEAGSGSMTIGSSDLELVFDGSDQKVGMRFNGMTIPPGATVTNAHIQFTADEAHSVATSLTIEGEATDDAATFTTSKRNISSRSKTASSVPWSPAPWTTVGEAGPDQRTPNIASVIQEIVDRPGWSSGNSLVVIVSGTGHRTAESYNGVRSAAPLLRVEFTVGSNDAPTAGFTWSATALTVDFTDTSTDSDGTVVEWSWDFGDGAASTAQNPSHTYAADGSYPVTLTVTDNDGATGTKTQTVSVASGAGDALEVRVAAGSDDAEERASGSMLVASSDLELVFDGSDQTVGMRFNGMTIPPGATTTNAHVQFTVDESHSVATSLTLQGEATDDAETFTTSGRNISSRSKTASSVSWSPAPWTTVGEAGPDQRTPNIASLIQEIVNRPGWSSGNSLVIIVSGTGHRTAESYNGVPGAAPLLHVEYTVGSNTAPTAGFTWSATGLTVDFTDASSDPDGTVVEWSWDFGDGGTSTAQNPSHTYGAAGDYPVTLTATDNEGATSTATQTVSVSASNQAPTASFTRSATALTVDFTDTSTDSDGTVVEWSWDFGDGGTSTLQNPSHTYAADGSYSVTLTVTDNDGATGTKTETVSVSAGTGTDDVIYVTSTGAGSVGGVAFEDEDILAYDGVSDTWSLHFDGSDVGLDGSNNRDVRGFELLANGDILLSVVGATTLPDVGSVAPSDIARFSGSTGPNTSGTFSLYLRGADVGLGGESIDAIGFAPDGRLVVSTAGAFNVPGASGGDEDLIALDAGGASWSLYFDGSDVDLNDSADEDVAGVSIDAVSEDIYLSTRGAFAVPGVSGGASDIFVCQPGALGSTTSCTYSEYWVGSAHGLTSNDVVGIHIGEAITLPNQAPTASFTWVATDLAAAFTDASYDPDGTVVAWSWDFGDGGTSALKNPSHTYDYTVTLTVTDNDGATGTTSEAVSVTNLIYITSTTAGSVGGVAFNDEDILAYDGGIDAWSMYFDGSDVSLDGSGQRDVRAFELLANGDILLSVNGSTTLPDVGKVSASDIVRFSGSTGPNTSGTFSFYLRGADVGLAREEIDAIGFAPDGRLVISTAGSFSVPGASGEDEDLIALDPGGSSWSLYFDGSDVGLAGSSDEDVAGVSIDGASGDIYLTTLGAFAVPGVSGDESAVFVCKPDALGSTTSCSFTSHWVGSEHGLTSNDVAGIHIGGATPSTN